jgi:hypothetical protein
MAQIGAFFMNWQQVVIVVVFVLGGVVLGLHQQETLAATILGAAAGFMTQTVLKGKESTPMTREEVVSILREMRDSLTPPPHT